MCPLLSYLYPTPINQREVLREAVSDKHLGTISRARVMALWKCGGQVIHPCPGEGRTREWVSVVPECLPSFTKRGTKQQEKLRGTQ